ncbi:HAMP domain-containing protein [Bacillus sp. V2I10]|uniref:HAMP domain-containing protein n=1 Tax=Bacillus sp. V2I10 TaxID=3042276 RepID=UPI002781AAAF|nr:HAMP domain-containing protein [Bacillus sp. V2I10]MDQ0859906.1 HAMP domain-containing protein [Bacillus sp. V2I10]
MKLNSITVKLGGIIMILFLAVLFPMVYTIDQLFRGFYYNQKQEEINYFASKYTETIKDVEDESSYHMFEMLSNISNSDLFVFNREGKILKSTGIMDFREGNEVKEEILSPILDKKDLKMEYSDRKTDNRYLIAAKPIIINNEINGGLVVVSNMESINSSVEQVRSWLSVSVIGSLLIAVGFIFFLSRKLSAPLLQMELATREIAKGKLTTKLIHSSQDEIGSLAKAITELGNELEEYRTNRREFFANISHELRTPIQSLI